jgi:hypothetical protein
MVARGFDSSGLRRDAVNGFVYPTPRRGVDFRPPNNPAHFVKGQHTIARHNLGNGAPSMSHCINHGVFCQTPLAPPGTPVAQVNLHIHRRAGLPCGAQFVQPIQVVEKFLRGVNIGVHSPAPMRTAAICSAL